MSGLWVGLAAGPLDTEVSIDLGPSTVYSQLYEFDFQDESNEVTHRGR